LNKETVMLNKIILLAAVAALAALVLPSRLEAWGAAHVGYAHVGPGGVYHTGRTVAAGPGGVYAGGSTAAYGAYGGAYRAGYGGAVGYGGAYGGSYRAGYAGGAAFGAARYGYIR
jgi:hypothetical protein